MKFKYVFLSVLVVCFGVNAFSIPKAPVKERKLYVGSDSTEAILTFKGKLFSGSRSLTKETAGELIESQVQHLYGPMSVDQFKGKSHAKAVPRGNHKITNVKIAKAPRGFEVTYNYSGTIVLQNGPKDKYDVILPINPNTIYKSGLIGKHNPCTDHHYQDIGDFWYFWNPENRGCTLKENEHYVVVPGTVKRIENSKLTYPEYDRLLDKNNNVTITLLMGMDDPTLSRNPNNSRDINAANFRAIKATLKERGYESEIWSDPQIKKFTKNEIEIYVEEFSKTIKGKSIIVRMFFGPSGIDEDSTSFHLFFKDALENQSVMMYDGHSGLGAHLDLESIVANIGALKPNKNRYQIYFFNSCTSYSYYNTMYFKSKRTSEDPKGTKNLDIFTNGLATYFSVMHETNFALVDAIEAYLSGKGRISYQALAKEIDSDNLFGINGDEDNP